MARRRRCPAPTGTSGRHATEVTQFAGSRVTRRMCVRSAAARLVSIVSRVSAAARLWLTIQANGSISARRRAA